MISHGVFFNLLYMAHSLDASYCAF